MNECDILYYVITTQTSPIWPETSQSHCDPVPPIHSSRDFLTIIGYRMFSIAQVSSHADVTNNNYGTQHL